jgi:hypothetical protein
MVKHCLRLMGLFFTRERFGQPQVLAGMLLLIFLAQCVWLADRGFARIGATDGEMFRIQQGLRQWHGQGIAGTANCSLSGPALQEPANSASQELGNDGTNNGSYDPYHSPLWYLAASGPLLLWPRPLQPDSIFYWGWLARAPYLIFGVLLGASLWYVARRLYGNMGGYIALLLYCFSPGILRASALWFAEPETGAAWGAFGAIFTAIAVAHTLYAPREVVLWNWRRIVLLGISLALAIGSQFSLVVVVPMALGFMLYLAPARKGAAIVIWLAACVVAAFLLFASYSFHPTPFLESMRQAKFLGITWQAFTMRAAYQQVFSQLTQSSPALVVAVPAALVAYLAWPRTRYFGNHAPLLVAVIFLFLAIAMPHHPGLGFQFLLLPFLFVFIAGVSADLLETRHRNLVTACVLGLLAAQAIWNVWELARTGRG